MFLEQEGLSYIGMNEIDQDFCRGFLHFLETAKNSVAKKQKGRIISKGCAHHHQAVLNRALDKAVGESILQQNPMKMLDKREKFQPSPEERDFLTIEEWATWLSLQLAVGFPQRSETGCCQQGLEDHGETCRNQQTRHFPYQLPHLYHNDPDSRQTSI